MRQLAQRQWSFSGLPIPRCEARLASGVLAAAAVAASSRASIINNNFNRGFATSSAARSVSASLAETRRLDVTKPKPIRIGARRYVLALFPGRAMEAWRITTQRGLSSLVAASHWELLPINPAVGLLPKLPRSPAPRPLITSHPTPPPASHKTSPLPHHTPSSSSSRLPGAASPSPLTIN